jgi:type IV secretion system protein VirD4
MLVEAGYDLKIFNTIEMANSDNYNPFHYVYDYEGNLSEDSVMKMIDVFMQNTKGEGEKDDFWSQSARKAITAIIFLLFEESEYHAKPQVTDEQKKQCEDFFKKELKDIGKEEIIEHLKLTNPVLDPKTRDFSSLNFFSVTEKMRKLVYPPQGTKDGYFFVQEETEAVEDFYDRREKAFLCPLDKDFIELERRKGGDTLATRLYKEIRNSPQETGQSIIATAGARTQMFNQKNLANLTCCDNIRLETLGDKKTALFIIISATNATYNFLAAMMYTQMFDVLANRANFKYGGVLPVHVRCIMDEFANIGQIPDFDKVIAFVRSMGMSLNVIIQNLAQLKARYEKTWEVITGNCDSLLFLGGKEASTLKEISESLGKETIDIEEKNRTVTGGHKNDSTAESNSIIGRELMTPDEIQKMPISNCILMIRSHNPFYCNKFPLEKHPNFKFTEDFDKSLAFDKYSVKAKTLEEFAAECEALNPKPKEEIPQQTGTHGKLEKTLYPKPEELDDEVISHPIQSYADIEHFSDGDIEVSVREEYTGDPKYGIPMELSSHEMPSEPDPKHFNEEEYVNEANDYKPPTIADDEEDDGWGGSGFAVPSEEVTPIENLENKEIKAVIAAKVETIAVAVKVDAKIHKSIDVFAPLM